jgi:hypothetical protein
VENNIRECVEKLILLVQWLITNLNVILYLLTCHTIYVSVLILFMIMPQIIINTNVSLTLILLTWRIWWAPNHAIKWQMGFNSAFKGLMYELKKNGKLFTSKFLGTASSSYEKRIYRAAVSQRLRDNAIDDCCVRFRVDRYFIFQNLTNYTEESHSWEANRSSGSP